MNLKFFFFCLVIIFSSLSLAQKNNIGLIRGTTSYPEWKITGDYSSYSTVFFKASLGNNQYLQKAIIKSYVSPFTTLKCTLNVNDTQDLSPGDYYYNIYAFGADTLVLVAGWLKLTRNVALDPIPLTFPRYTIVTIDTPSANNNFIVGMDSNNVWYQKTLAQTKTILGIDTLTLAGSLPDSIIYTSETADFVDKSTTQTITGQKNFMGTVKFGDDSSIVVEGDSIEITKASPYKFLLLGRSDQSDSYIQIDVDNSSFVLSPRTNVSGFGTPNKTIALEVAKLDETGDQVYSWGITEDRFATAGNTLRLMNSSQTDYIDLTTQNIVLNGTVATNTGFIYCVQDNMTIGDDAGQPTVPLTLAGLNVTNPSYQNTFLGDLFVGSASGDGSNAQLQINGSISFDSASTVTSINNIVRLYDLSGVYFRPLAIKDLYLDGDTTTSITHIFIDSTLQVLSQDLQFNRMMQIGRIGIRTYGVEPPTIVGQSTIYSDDGELKVKDESGDITVLSDIISLPDTASIPAGFVPKKQSDGSISWEADAGGAGSDSASFFEKNGQWHATDSLKTIDELDIDYQAKNTDLDNPDLALNLVQDSLTVKANRSELGTGAYATIANYSLTSHTHTEFYDTLSKSWGVMDTVTTGDYVGWKVENNITITEVAAYTNTGTVTFNLEERGEATPNTAGTDVMTSDLVADTDQQETGTFSNAAIDRDDWLVPTVTSISGDPTIFSITVRYVKTN